jgi:TPR repeat protein
VRPFRYIAFFSSAILLSWPSARDVQAGDSEDCDNQTLLQTEPVQVARACRNAAAQGDARAQDNLGNLYVRGQGVARDYAQAAVWFRRSAIQNNTQGQFDLGTLYDYCHGVSQDYELAYIWYNLAAIGGHDVLHLASAFRDSAGQHLTSSQLADARRRSRAWKPGAEP